MIVSHLRKFIFISNPKTASTSIAIALSSLCGKDDIITPFDSDEKVRRSLGYPGAQNYVYPGHLLPYLWIRESSRIRRTKIGKRIRRHCFYTHMPPAELKQRLPKAVWEGYHRFCFVRNPWDRVISQYFWQYREYPDRPELDDFIASPGVENLAARSLAMLTVDDELAVDRICRFENLETELVNLSADLGDGQPLALPQTKTMIRKDRRSYRDVLSPQQGERIGRLFQKELQITGYSF